MSQLLRQGKKLNTKRIITIFSLLMVAVMFLTFSGTALATGGGNPNEDCPDGTVQVAKFNVFGNGFYIPDGGSNGVVISNGTLTGANWTSTKAISRVIVKGGSGPIAIKNYDYNPPANSGSFNNTGLQNHGGQTPNISNVKFCGPQPPKPGKIKVKKFEDDNKDQDRDSGEDWLKDWDFTVTGDSYNESDDTNSSGEVEFKNVPPGTYEVCETLQTGWANTTPLCQTVVVQSDKTTEVIFGNIKPLDPEFLCWIPVDHDTYRGYFGYINDSSLTLTVPVSGGLFSTQNRLTSSNGVQNTIFAPGNHTSFTSPAFYVDFEWWQSVKWYLMGREAETSKHDSKRCKFKLEVEKIWEGSDAPGAINDLITLSNGNSATCDWTGTELDCDPDSIWVSAYLNGNTPTADYSVDENTALLPANWSLKSGEGDFSIPNEHLECVGNSCTHTVVNKYTPPPGSITIKKVTTSESNAEFGFKDHNGQPFPVQGGGFKLFENLTPGSYTFSEETMPTGWQFDDIICENVSYQENGQSVTVDLPSGVNATCMFYNSNPASSIKVTKTASDPTSLPEPGGNFTYTVKVENTSPYNTVTITSLVDDQFGSLDGAGDCSVPQVLGIGGSYECTFSGNVTKSILTNGEDYVHTNVVTASGKDDENNDVSDDDDATVKVTNVPSSITVEKTANPDVMPEPGGQVEFSVKVTNTSTTDNVTIEHINDDVFGNLDGECGLIKSLAPNESFTCVFYRDVVGDAANPHTNVASVTGYDDDGQPVEGKDDATVTFTNVDSAITVIKTADPLELPEPGGDFTFTVRVINNSVADAVTITSLVDTKFDDLDGVGTCDVPVVLQPANAGDTDEYTCTFTKTINGVSGYEHTNVVTAGGTDDDGEPVENSDDATVKIIDPLKGTIKVKKVVEGTDKIESFKFYTSFAGNIYVDAGATAVYNEFPGQGFSVTEVVDELPQYYSLKSTTCVSNVNGIVNPDSFSLASEEVVTCTTINVYEPPQCEGLRKDLTGRIEISGLTALGYVKNNTDRDCNYQVGIASYEKFNELLKDQKIWDYANPPSILIPANTEILAVQTSIPECATQVDLFYGSVILDFSGGAKYGNRLLAYLHLPGTGYCETREQEQPKDTDGDGTIDRNDTDDDNDGLSDAEERDLGTDPKSPDTDGDKLTDFEEVRIHQTNPLSKDTDGDGLRDDKDSEPTIFNDLDGDGIGDGDDDQDNRDSDGDGLENWEDAEPDTFNDADCDTIGDGDDDTFDDLYGDGIGDGCDDQDNRDSDGDGLENWEDAEPDTFNDLDGDGIGDGNDDQDNRDSDGDGLENWEDAEPDVFNDADGDGVGDGNDICPAGDDNVDEDGNGTPDACDEPADGGEETTPGVGGGRRTPEVDVDVIKGGRNRE